MYLLIYMTAPNKEEAKRIGRILVEERLAACVNIFPEIDSFYWWQGKLEDEREAVVVAKTTEAQRERLVQRVVELHPYECPCILSFKIDGGYEPFLNWIGEETKSS
ncbi:MAG: divalent-cation tolerance protein CutA [Desulfatiglandales bacterium]